MRRELICTEPASPPRLQVREVPLPELGRGEVLVRVTATSINPIDAKRAGGYGQRVLGLKGAARFPLVLGNDVVGRIDAIGPGVTRFALSQHVFGLVATGKRGGAHASHVVVPQSQLQSAPKGIDAASLAVLPYSFTTMWLALHGAGLTPANASGKRVLVQGAAGALGRMSLVTLNVWGSHVTAICSAAHLAECRALGAQHAVERGPGAIEALPTDFDAVLNFASWDDELALASRLGQGALGHATTVHPLANNFDRLGWLRGALTTRHDFMAMRAAVRGRSPNARYAWTIFKPDPDALVALESGLRNPQLSVPVGLSVPLDRAEEAFAHVASGKPGRAVLLP